MTITVKIKHDTPGSPWSVSVNAIRTASTAPDGTVGEVTEQQMGLLAPGEEASFTMWDSSSLHLREVKC